MAMSDEDKLAQVRLLTGATGQDDLLKAYLASAQSLVLLTRHPFSSDPDSEKWESRYDALQCEVAADMFDRRGAEGELTHKENGVERTWATGGVSKHLLQRIVPLGKAISL